MTPHQNHHVDPALASRSTSTWGSFMRYTTYATVAAIVVLSLMAALLT